ncbi:MAG: tripartite tricarboxylate transporter TctB family protein [Burkholderiales bacterium]
MLPYAIVGSAAAYLFYVATQIDFHRRAGTLGPDVWPKLVLGLMLAVCLYEIVRLLLSPQRRGGAAGVLQEMIEQSKAAHGQAAEATAPASPLLLVGGIALTALYVWIIQRLGFVLATAPYLAAFIALGGYRRWAINLAVSGIGTLVMMFFFMKVVYISLPVGQEPFAQVTFALMRLMGIR